MQEKTAAEKPAWSNSPPKSPRTSRRDREHTRRNAAASAGAARKDSRQARPGPRPHAGVCCGCARGRPGRGHVAPEEQRDANEMARAAIERLRGAGRAPPRQDAARVPDAPSADVAGPIGSDDSAAAAADHGLDAGGWNANCDDRVACRRPAPSAADRPADSARRHSAGLAAPASPPLDLRAEATPPLARRAHDGRRRHALRSKVGVSRGIAEISSKRPFAIGPQF